MPAPGGLQHRHRFTLSETNESQIKRDYLWRSRMKDQFDADVTAAVLAFNEEAVLYCRGISDTATQEYARNYARMLMNRAQGLEFSLPRIPQGLFEPNRNLIRSTLERMSDKYFRAR
jgi:hypothetical protein